MGGLGKGLNNHDPLYQAFKKIKLKKFFLSETSQAQPPDLPSFMIWILAAQITRQIIQTTLDGSQTTWAHLDITKPKRGLFQK